MAGKRILKLSVVTTVIACGVLYGQRALVRSAPMAVAAASPSQFADPDPGSGGADESSFGGNWLEIGPKGSLGSSRYAPCASLRVGPQPPVAVGLTGLDNTGQRMVVNDVEPNKVVYREPAVQVGHGAFRRPRIRPAARRLRFHKLCRFKSLERGCIEADIQHCGGYGQVDIGATWSRIQFGRNIAH